MYNNVKDEECFEVYNKVYAINKNQLHYPNRNHD